MGHHRGASPPRLRAAGVTLIELLLGMSVTAVLLALAVPSFREITASSRASSVESDLVTALNLARSESLRRGVPVSLCPSADGATCAASTDWASGWIVFTDDSGTPGARDGTDVLLQVWGPVQGDVHVQPVGGAVPFVQFQPAGSTLAPATFAVVWSGCAGADAHQVQVLGTGLVSVQSVSCSSS